MESRGGGTASSRASRRRLRRLERLGSDDSVSEDSSSSSSSSSGAEGLPEASQSSEETSFIVDALPRDRTSLEEELARVCELEALLQKDSAPDYVLGCEILAATRHKRVARAHAALERRKRSAMLLFEYASEQARQTYATRCAELQRDMDDDLTRELRRLQSAKDAVSVTSRRRRSLKESNGFSATNESGYGPSNGVRRRRVMYASDGDDDAPEDVFYASASPAERAQRLRFREKKRIEALLARSSVFQPAVPRLKPEEVAEDLHVIQSSIPGDYGSNYATAKRKPPEIRSKASSQGKVSVKAKQKMKKTPSGRRRPRVVTPRRIPRAHAPAYDLRSPLAPALTSVAQPKPVETTAMASRRRRLQFNPKMLQEGQEVVVYRHPSATTAGQETEERVRVLSGIITAATATQVYLLTASGRFEAFDVRDCVRGLLSVHVVDVSGHPKGIADSRQPGAQ